MGRPGWETMHGFGFLHLPFVSLSAAVFGHYIQPKKNDCQPREGSFMKSYTRASATGSLLLSCAPALFAASAAGTFIPAITARLRS